MGQMRPLDEGETTPLHLCLAPSLSHNRISDTTTPLPPSPTPLPSLLTSLYTPIWLRGPLCPFCAFLASHRNKYTRFLHGSCMVARLCVCKRKNTVRKKGTQGYSVCVCVWGRDEGSRISYLGLEAPFSLAFHGRAAPLAAAALSRSPITLVSTLSWEQSGRFEIDSLPPPLSFLPLFSKR